jgi:hypothetical protein
LTTKLQIIISFIPEFFLIDNQVLGLGQSAPFNPLF